MSKKNHKNSSTYFKSDKSNEEQDSKMLYWLFLAPQTKQANKKSGIHINDERQLIKSRSSKVRRVQIRGSASKSLRISSEREGGLRQLGKPRINSKKILKVLYS